MRTPHIISKFGLKTKLILLMVGVGVFPLILGMLFSYSQANKSLHDVIGSNFQALAYETADKVNLIINEEILRNIRIADFPGIIQSVREQNTKNQGLNDSLKASHFFNESLEWSHHVYGVHPLLENKGSLALKTSMNEFTPSNESTHAVFVTDRKGVLVSSINFYPDFVNPRWSLSKKSQTESLVYLSGVFLDPKSNKHVFQISIPVIDRLEQNLGTLHRVYSAKKFFSALLGTVHFGKTGHAMIIDSTGTVIDCPVLPTGYRLSNMNLVKRVTGSQPGWAQTQGDGHGNRDQSIIGFSPLFETNSVLINSKGKPWHIFVWQASDELFAPTRKLLTWMAFAGTFLVVLLVLMGTYASNRITKPIRKLQEATTRIGRGDMLVRVSVDSGGEIGELAECFNKMTQTLKATRLSEQNHLDRLQQALANLKESEMRLQAIMENALDSIMTIDEKGIIQTFNPATEKIFGYKASEAIGKSVNLLMPEPDKSQHDEYIQRYLRTGVAKIIGFGREVYGLRKDGSVFLMELAVSEMHLEGRRQFIGIVRDLSERKQAEEEFKKHSEEIKSLSKFPSENPSPVLRVGDDGTVLYANAPALSLLGPGNNQIGGPIASYFRPVISRALESNLSKESEVNLKNRIFSFEVMPVVDANYVNIYGRDITERKQAEDEVRNSREQLRNLSRKLQSIQEEERSRIAREIHDELGQALTALSLDLAWIERRLPQEQDSILIKIGSMIPFIDATIKRVQRIATELRPEILDMLGLCDALKWQTKEFKKRTGIQCELTLHPKKIHLDPDRSTTFFRIYQEALTNVARHADASEVFASFKQNQNQLELEVRDNGKGIEEDQISNIKSLGLTGIYERALPWGGTVLIKGRPGKGTTITVRIPINPS